MTESSTSASPSSTTTSASDPAIAQTSNHHSGFPVGAIAGIVVAVALIALAIGGYFLRKNLNKRKQRRDAAELGTDAPLPKDRQEVEGTPAAQDLYEKRVVETNDYPVHTGMESPPLEMGGDRVTFEDYYGPTKTHGSAMELATEPIPRSELSSPEPLSGRATPTLLQARSELSTPDPTCAEMASPFYSAHSHPSPPVEVPSALSSPRSLQKRPSLRHSQHGRLPSTTSDESGFVTLPIQGVQGVQRTGSQNSFSRDGTALRPVHIRKDSDDSAFTQDTVHAHRLSQRRKNSAESGLTNDTIHARRPSHSRVDSNDSTVSDALLSPSPFNMHEPAAMAPRVEEAEEELDQDSDSPLVGRDDVVPAIAQLGRRGSANLITQLSPPSSPSRSTTSIPRKEVASPTPPPTTAVHRRQESTSGAQQAPPSAYSHLSAGSAGGRVRSSSSASGSRFEEDFREELSQKKGSFESRRK